MERSFAHVGEMGEARRSGLHGLENVTHRYLMYVAGKNLGAIMRALFDMSKPRTLPTEGGGGFSLRRANTVAAGDVFRSIGGVVALRIHLADSSPSEIVARHNGFNSRPILSAA